MPPVGTMPAGGGPFPPLPTSRGKRTWFVAAGVLVLVLLLAAGTVLVLGGGKDAAALTVTLQSISDVPDRPFTASVVSVSPKSAESFHSSVKLNGASGTLAGLQTVSVRGDVAALYGVSPVAAVCDSSRLVKLIRADSAKAEAWSSAMGTSPSKVSHLVGELTPVLLGHDTAVTDHQLVGARSETTQAVLQAGTAVLIDGRGTPAVRCASGDPLTASEVGSSAKNPTADVRLDGTRWSGFDEGNVAAVAPTPKPVSTISAINIDTGKTVVAGIGGMRTLDGYLVSDDQGVKVVSLDGKTTTAVIDHQVARAIDDGAGGIIFQELHSDPADESKLGSAKPYDVESMKTSNADEAAIWHLAAGETTPTKLVVPDTASSWLELEDVGLMGGRRVLVFAEWTDRSTEAMLPIVGDLKIFDLERSKSIGTVPPVYSDIGSATGLTVASLAHDELLYGVNNSGNPTSYMKRISLEADGRLGEASTVNKLGPPPTDPNSVFAKSILAAVITDEGNLLALPPTCDDTDLSAELGDMKTGRVVKTIPISDSSNTEAGSTSAFRWDQFGGIAIGSCRLGNGSWGQTIRVDMASGTAAPVALRGWVRPLRAPVVRPAADDTPNSPRPAPSVTTAPTTPPPTAPPTTAAATPRQLVESGTQVDVNHFMESSWSDTGPLVSGGLTAFMSPTGQIKCGSYTAIDPGGPVAPNLICTVNDATFPQIPPSPPCGGTPIHWSGNLIKLDADGPTQGVCAGGVMVPAQMNTLEYGSTIRFGDFACYLAQDGLTCLNSRDQGWFVSQSVYREYR